MNVPVTFPPEPVNGVLVSGLLTPKGAIFTHPHEHTRQLLDEGYAIHLERKTSNEAHLRALLDVTQRRWEAARRLLDAEAWDLAMVMFEATDNIHHTMWDDRERIATCYNCVDEIVGDLAARAGPNSSIFIISDHGGQTVPKRFYVNEWLAELGLLRYTLAPEGPSTGEWSDIQSRRAARSLVSRLIATMGQVLQRMGISQDRLLDWIERYRLGWVRQIVPAAMRRDLYSGANLVINWPETRAYLFSPDSQGVNINLQGREPLGTVAPGTEYENLRDEITEALQAQVDPENGQPVVERVLRREALYHGPFVDLAPDLIVVTRGQQYYLDGNKGDGLFGRMSSSWGGHSMDGVLIAHGSEIARGARVEGARLVDLAPSLLHLLGQSLPEDLDGEILWALFGETSRARQTDPLYGPASQLDTDAIQRHLQPHDMEIVESRLRELGYLG